MKPGKSKQGRPGGIALPNPRGAQHPVLPVLRFDQPNFGVPENLEVKHLAAEEQSLLGESVVDLSKAREFFKKHVSSISWF